MDRNPRDHRDRIKDLAAGYLDEVRRLMVAATSRMHARDVSSSLYNDAALLRAILRAWATLAERSIGWDKPDACEEAAIRTASICFAWDEGGHSPCTPHLVFHRIQEQGNLAASRPRLVVDGTREIGRLARALDRRVEISESTERKISLALPLARIAAVALEIALACQ